jgi:hypothetical protein
MLLLSFATRTFLPQFQQAAFIVLSFAALPIWSGSSLLWASYQITVASRQPLSGEYFVCTMNIPQWGRYPLGEEPPDQDGKAGGAGGELHTSSLLGPEGSGYFLLLIP